MIVGHPHPPAVVGRRAGQGEVAAERDERAGPGRREHRGGGAIGRQGLGCGPEVELDSGGHPDGPSPLVDVHRLPAGHHGDAHSSGASSRQRLVVTVIPERAHDAAERGIDVAVSYAGGPQSRLHGIEEKIADRDSGAAGPGQPGDLGVVAKARAGPVKVRQHVLHHALRGLERRALCHPDHGGAPPHREAGKPGCHCRRAAAQEPPDTGPGCGLGDAGCAGALWPWSDGAL